VSPIPPPAPLPEVVEAELGVREYWYEVFRRVLVVPDGDGCYLLSIDVYSTSPPAGEERAVLSASLVKLRYMAPGLEPPRLNGVKPEYVEAVVVETPGRREIVNVRLRYCGLSDVPSHEAVAGVYREIVTAVEGRDPARLPLTAPEPVARVYASRGLLRRRGRGRTPRPH